MFYIIPNHRGQHVQHSKTTKSLTYSEAGVDIDKGEALIGDIAPHAKRTKRAGATSELGGFGGLFDIKAAGFVDPVLVASTDGVGTKLELAKTTGLHHAVGIDQWQCVQTIF